MVQFQRLFINDATNICKIKTFFDQDISTSQKFTFMISRTLIIRASAVYLVALIQPIVSSLVVTNRKAEVQVTADRPVMLGLVPVKLSTSISGSHAATYVVNAYVS